MKLSWISMKRILTVTEAIDIVLWPVAMDFKYDHLRSMEDGEIALSILSGSVRNSDHQEMAELLRENPNWSWPLALAPALAAARASQILHQRRNIQLGLPGCAHSRQSKQNLASKGDGIGRKNAHPSGFF